MDRVLKEHAMPLPVVPGTDFWAGLDFESSSHEEDLVRKRAWRAQESHLDRLRAIAKMFEGTHNFHNFTVSREPKDGTNKRYMKTIQVRPSLLS